MPPDDNIIRPTQPNWISPTPREDKQQRYSDGEGGGVNPPLGERLARLEAAVEALRRSHDIIIGIVALGFTLIITLMIGLGAYTLSRIDTLPADFARTNQLLSSAITATKQQPAQIILVPAPAPISSQTQKNSASPKGP